jgi:hypothetical protein
MVEDLWGGEWVGCWGVGVLGFWGVGVLGGKRNFLEEGKKGEKRKKCEKKSKKYLSEILVIN